MESIENLAQNLRNSFVNSGKVTLDDRIFYLNNLKKIILEYQDEINQALKADLGKSEFESYATEVGFILEDIKFTLKNIKSWIKPKRVPTNLALQPGKSFVYPEPYGAVLIISPWNYPFQLALSPLIGAVAAGNKVVLKPSELSPNTSLVIKKILDKVFKKSDVSVIQGGVEVSTILLSQKWDYIFFTGSTAVGKIVMKAAAEHLTPVTLELGGKSPCIIEESADLDLAAKRVVWGKYLNCGQTCVAPDYVLVHETLQEEFILKLKKYIELFFSNDQKQSPDYSRIIGKRHLERLISFIDKSKLVIGGDHDIESKYLNPTVLNNVQWNDRVMEEEIFGPILPILTYKNFSDIFSMISNFSRPLALYVFSNNKAKTDEVLTKLSFGGGCVNDTLMHLANPHLPFGGIGDSGVGSYHGRKSFETFSHFKSVFYQSRWIDIPVRYPPYKGKLGILKYFLN